MAGRVILPSPTLLGPGLPRPLAPLICPGEGGFLVLGLTGVAGQQSLRPTHGETPMLDALLFLQDLTTGMWPRMAGGASFLLAVTLIGVAL